MRALVQKAKEMLDNAFEAHPYGWGWFVALSSGVLIGLYDIAAKGLMAHLQELLLPEQIVFHFGLPFILGGSVSRRGQKLGEERARHQAEKELAQSEEKHRSLAANIPGIVYRRYPRENNRIEFFTPDFVAELTGYTVEELTSHTPQGLLDIIDENDRPLFAEESTHPDQQGRYERDFGIRRKNGDYRYAHERGRVLYTSEKKPLHIDGVVFDMTERREIQNALRTERDFAENLLKSAQVMVVVLDPDGKINRYNPYTEKVVKRPLEETRGLDWFDTFVPPSERIRARRRFQASLDGKISDAVLITIESSEEWQREILWHERPLHDGERQIIGILAVGHDVTEQRQLEHRLHQSEKMQAIGQLAGGIAHDFNNQLSGILGYAEMARERAGEDARQARYLNHIHTAAQRSADLTAKLLAYARKGKFRSVSLDMHSLIGEVVGMLERSIDRRIRIVQKLNAQTPHTTGDPTQIQSALLNVALNARDALPTGGEIVFETDVAILDPMFCAHKSPFDINPGHYLKVTIADNGIGMDDPTQRRIFEPFFTTKPPGEGTGMGLAAVYGTIKTHRGAVEVISAPHQGTSFVLYLPLTQQFVPFSTHSSADKPQPGTGTILLIDDEPILCDLVTDVLEGLGYTVNAIYDSLEALQFYRNAWETIDLVILDLVMPNMTGAEVFSELQRINPAVSVLLASGYSVDGETQQLLANGAKGFLQKPFHRIELSRRVASLVSHSNATDTSSAKKPPSTGEHPPAA